MYVKMRLTLFLIAGWFVMASALGQSSPPRLTVASGGHTLLHDKLDAQGQTPFFWLGDTAWELFSALNQNEAIRYLDDRAGKKFTVVQAHLLPWELTELNALGQTVFVDNDFDRPNEAYWQHVDFIVQQASQRGLYLALLPAWCRTYIEPKGSPLHSDSLKAYRYGRFLGQRYRAYLNLIWVLGGRQITDAPHHLPSFGQRTNRNLRQRSTRPHPVHLPPAGRHLAATGDLIGRVFPCRTLVRL
jgi:hypothetical protein